MTKTVFLMDFTYTLLINDKILAIIFLGEIRAKGLVKEVMRVITLIIFFVNSKQKGEIKERKQEKVEKKAMILSVIYMAKT